MEDRTGPASLLLLFQREEGHPILARVATPTPPEIDRLDSHVGTCLHVKSPCWGDGGESLVTKNRSRVPVASLGVNSDDAHPLLHTFLLLHACREPDHGMWAPAPSPLPRGQRRDSACPSLPEAATATGAYVNPSSCSCCSSSDGDSWAKWCNERVAAAFIAVGGVCLGFSPRLRAESRAYLQAAKILSPGSTGRGQSPDSDAARGPPQLPEGGNSTSAIIIMTSLARARRRRHRHAEAGQSCPG